MLSLIPICSSLRSIVFLHIYELYETDKLLFLINLAVKTQAAQTLSSEFGILETLCGKKLLVLYVNIHLKRII